MNKRTTLTIAALVTVSIMLSAAGIMALAPSQPGNGPGVVVDPEIEELADEIVAEVAAQGGHTDKAAVITMLLQAQGVGADMSSTDLKTQDDIASNEMGCWGLHECSWDLWVSVCPPVYETHAAIMWDECTKSDLDLYMCGGGGGYAVSNAAHTLTEEAAISGCSLTFIWVHAAQVTPYSTYQEYKIAIDYELPKICPDDCID